MHYIATMKQPTFWQQTHEIKDVMSSYKVVARSLFHQEEHLISQTFLYSRDNKTCGTNIECGSPISITTRNILLEAEFDISIAYLLEHIACISKK